MSVHPVMRKFAYRKDTKSLQMSGKNSRLGSKDLAKGGLTEKEAKEIEAEYGEPGKTPGEKFYFRSGHKRNPLLVIYPVKLYYEPKDEDSEEYSKAMRRIVDSIECPVVGLSIGIPMIHGVHEMRVKYKINKQKWLEIFGAEDVDDFAEVDDTIPEE